MSKTTATSTKLTPGSQFPSLFLKGTNGAVLNTSATGKYKLVVVYRGQFCPFCQSKY